MMVMMNIIKKVLFLYWKLMFIVAFCIGTLPRVINF